MIVTYILIGVFFYMLGTIVYDNLTIRQRMRKHADIYFKRLHERGISKADLVIALQNLDGKEARNKDGV